MTIYEKQTSSGELWFKNSSGQKLKGIKAFNNFFNKYEEISPIISSYLFSENVKNIDIIKDIIIIDTDGGFLIDKFTIIDNIPSPINNYNNSVQYEDSFSSHYWYDEINDIVFLVVGGLKNFPYTSDYVLTVYRFNNKYNFLEKLNDIEFLIPIQNIKTLDPIKFCFNTDTKIFNVSQLFYELEKKDFNVLSINFDQFIDIDKISIIKNPTPPNTEPQIIITSNQYETYLYPTDNLKVIANKYDLDYKNVYGDDVLNTTWYSENSGIATIDNTGEVSYVSDGLVNIKAISPETTSTKVLEFSSINISFIDNVIFSQNFQSTSLVTETFNDPLTSYVIGILQNNQTVINLSGIPVNKVNYTYTGPVSTTNNLVFYSSGNDYFTLIVDFIKNINTYESPVNYYNIPYSYTNISLIDKPFTTFQRVSSYKDRVSVHNVSAKTWEISYSNIFGITPPSSLKILTSGPIDVINNNVISLSSNRPFSIALSSLSTVYTTNNTSTTSLLLSTGYFQNSLALHMKNEIEKRLIGPSSNFVPLNTIHPRMSYYIDNARSARNPNCWVADIDLSFYSVTKNNSTDNSGSRAILVAPDICLFTKHYQKDSAYPVTVTWKSSAGVTYTGYIPSSSWTYGYYDHPLPGDIVVARMISSVNSEITPAKFLPSTWKSYIPSWTVEGNTKTYRLDGISGTQDQKYGPVSYLQRGNTMRGESRNDWWQCFGYSGHDGYLVGGDSSSPLGFIVNGEFLFGGIAMYAFFSPGCFYPLYLDSINQSMSALGSSFQLNIADLSEFPTFD